MDGPVTAACRHETGRSRARPRGGPSSQSRAEPKALKAKAIAASANCDEACRVTVSSSIRIAGQKKAVKLPARTLSLKAGRLYTVKLALSSGLRRTMSSALRKRRKVTASITFSARDAAGNAVKRSAATRIVG